MTIADQRRRLAKLEAQRKRRVFRESQGTPAIVTARATAYALFCAVEGIGGPEMFEHGRAIAAILASVPSPTPERLAEIKLARAKAHLRHAV